MLRQRLEFGNALDRKIRPDLCSLFSVVHRLVGLIPTGEHSGHHIREPFSSPVVKEYVDDP